MPGGQTGPVLSLNAPRDPAYAVPLQAGDKAADWDGKSSVNGGRDQKAEMFPIDTSVADAPGVRVTVESETDFEQFPGKEKH